MSVTSGGQALKALIAGGSRSGSVGSAGISITFLTAHRAPSRYQTQIDDDRSFRDTTQLTKPYALVGSCAGRSSKTSWYSGDRKSTRLNSSHVAISYAVFCLKKKKKKK